ncbi:MAG: DUF938 domain-containing protein [Xanthomonadales bacterium]|nr:DUF938 domain-containing protein [Xanthomonadales bacterium]
MEQDLPFAPACERNKQPILEVLQRVLPQSGLVLEIGSGTGQHLVHFSAHLPQLLWQPTEQVENLPGLQRRLDMEAGSSVLPAMELNVAAAWPVISAAAVISANTAHIMGWQEVICMFGGVANILAEGGPFCLYGPFNQNGEFTSESNQQFDRDLKWRKASMGIRDVTELEKLAGRRHMKLEQQIALPANNQMLVFRKDSETSA